MPHIIYLNHENMLIDKVSVFGLDFISAESIADVADTILAYQPVITDTHLPLVITPNVDDVVQFSKRKNAAIARHMPHAAFILPDGQFIVWASRLIGKPIKSRLPGSDLFPVLWKKAIAQHKRILLIAPSLQVAQPLQKEYPDLQYYVPPFFEVDNHKQFQEILEAAMRQVALVQPELVLIGIRFPKQHMLALEMINRCHTTNKTKGDQTTSPLFLLLGASYEFYVGIKKRAPVFMQKTGTEWFHRFIQEPRRLFKRFFIEDLAFFPMVVREYFRSRIHT